jgi:uncharacterized protein (TIGR04255 family)
MAAGSMGIIAEGPMPEPCHLSRAPIREALIDLRVAEAAGSPEAWRAALEPVLHAQYPHVELRQRAGLSLELKDGPSIPRAEQPVPYGCFFKSDDGSRIVQARVDGLTYNRLAPYDSWDEMLPEGLRLWELYRAVAQPTSVTRVAVRYINALSLPTGELARYLTAPPVVPEGVSASLEGFLTRVVLEQPDGVRAVVTQALEPTPNVDGTSSVILDIDVFRVGAFPTNVSDLTPELDRLRTIKNTLFFSFVTTATVDLFR